MIWILGWLVCVWQIFQYILLDGFNAPSNFLGYVIATLMWGLCSLLAVLPWMGLAAFIGLAFATNAVEESSRKLAALRVKDGVNGHFYLGSGTVKGEQYFFYYVSNGDGSFEPSQVSADSDVKIFEEDRKDAQVIHYRAEFVKNWPWIVGMPTLQGKKSVVFRVPTGTIKPGYEM